MNETLAFGSMLGHYSGLIIYIIVCTALLAATVIQGRKRNETTGIEREALGTSRFSWWIVGITVAATMLGPADALGLSQKGFEYGWLWVLGPIGAAFAQIVAGLFFVHKIKEQPGSPQTLGDMFTARFGSSPRSIVGVIVVMQAVAFSGLLILAGAQILHTFIGVPQIYGIIVTSLFIGLYTAIGGLNTIVKTDIFQGILIAVLLLFVAGTTAVLALTSPNLVQALPLATPAFSADFTFGAMLAITLTYFFGELLLPFYSQRALAAKSASHARIGFVVAGLIAAVWYLVVTASGAIGNALQSVNQPEFVLLSNLQAVVGTTGPLAWFALTIAFVGLIALMHSTFDAILNSGGVAFSRDIVGSFMQLTDKQQGTIARWSMLGISLLGMAIPFIWNDLIDILLIGYTIWAPTLMPIFAWLILTRPERVSAAVFWVPLAAGLGGWLLSPYILPEEFVPAILTGVVLNVLAILVVNRFRSRPVATV